MSYPTLYLNILILLASVFPSGFAYSINYVIGFDKWKIGSNTMYLILLTLCFTIILGAVSALSENLVDIGVLPEYSHILLALVFAPVAFLVEYLLLIAINVAGTKKLVTRIALHKNWAGKLGIVHHFLTVCVVVGEEIIFRKLWLFICLQYFEFDTITSLLLSSLAYGINHIFFGVNSVLTKTASGLIYGALYLASGSLLVPIITHLVHNYLILLLSKNSD